MLSDEALHSLASHCPLLRAIGLIRVRDITDAGFIALAKACPLEEVELSDIWGLADEWMHVLAEHCASSLLTLRIAGVGDPYDISLAALATVMDKCTKLRQVEDMIHMTLSMAVGQRRSIHFDRNE